MSRQPVHSDIRTCIHGKPALVPGCASSRLRLLMMALFLASGTRGLASMTKVLINTYPPVQYCLINRLDAFVRMLYYILPPEPQHRPVLPSERFLVLCIALHVPGYLLYPVCTVIPLLQPEFQLIPVFPMEEFTVTEYGDPVLRDHDIRRSWKRLIVFSVSVPVVPESLAEDQFYGGVLRADCRHVLMTLFWREHPFNIPN